MSSEKRVKVEYKGKVYELDFLDFIERKASIYDGDTHNTLVVNMDECTIVQGHQRAKIFMQLLGKGAKK